MMFWDFVWNTIDINVTYVTRRWMKFLLNVQATKSDLEYFGETKK